MEGERREYLEFAGGSTPYLGRTPYNGGESESAGS